MPTQLDPLFTTLCTNAASAVRRRVCSGHPLSEVARCFHAAAASRTLWGAAPTPRGAAADRKQRRLGSPPVRPVSLANPRTPDAGTAAARASWLRARAASHRRHTPAAIATRARSTSTDTRRPQLAARCWHPSPRRGKIQILQVPNGSRKPLFRLTVYTPSVLSAPIRVVAHPPVHGRCASTAIGRLQKLRPRRASRRRQRSIQPCVVHVTGFYTHVRRPVPPLTALAPSPARGAPGTRIAATGGNETDVPVAWRNVVVVLVRPRISHAHRDGSKGHAPPPHHRWPPSPAPPFSPTTPRYAPPSSPPSAPSCRSHSSLQPLSSCRGVRAGVRGERGSRKFDSPLQQFCDVSAAASVQELSVQER